ncbi:MAG: transposase [Candidatus Gracilibacteria bacterium]|nr:transposase [Candidatus Gracilibacteria bacterium]
MSKMLTDSLNNTYRSLLKGMGLWEKRFFKDFFPALLQSKTSIMSKITLDKTKKAKKVCDRNSHFLAKENFAKLPDKVEKRCFALLGEIKDDDYICIDEVDIAKPSAKLMEGIYKVHDSSENKTVNGFLFHGVSIRGIPVILQQEDIENNTKNGYFGEIIKRLIKYTKGKGTIVLDAGYDIKTYMSFLLEKDANFIVRAKRERILYDESGNSIGKMKSFKEGIHEVYLKQDDNTLTKVYFYVKQFPEYDTPMRIYSNTNDRNVEEYKKRWEIECIFKTMKQEYEMEKIQAGSLQVLQNMVATIQMAVAFATHLYGLQHKKESKTFFKCDKLLIKKFERFHWREGGKMNPNMYIRFLSEYVENSFKKKPKKQYKKHINTEPNNSSQQRLFSMRELGKRGVI